MFGPTESPCIANAEELETQARHCIQTLSDRIGLSFHKRITIIIRKDTERSIEDKNASMEPPVVIHTPHNEPILFLRANYLVNRPLSVLEGGLALELTNAALQQEPERFQLNFEKEILPLFNVAGSAVQFIRRLVMHIEIGLKRFYATEIAIRAGFGGEIFFYYFNMLQRSDADRRHYINLIHRHWIRAMYLTQKNSVYIPIPLLDKMGIASGIRDLWRDCHDYLLPEDHKLLVELADTPHRLADRPFTDHVVAMFRKIKVTFLA
jgi:hypothetical protein